MTIRAQDRRILLGLDLYLKKNWRGGELQSKREMERELKWWKHRENRLIWRIEDAVMKVSLRRLFVCILHFALASGY